MNPTTNEPFSVSLPDCRAYEVVSPLDKQGQEAVQGMGAGAVSPDGERATYASLGAFSGATSFSGTSNGNQYLGVRGSTGWATSTLFAPGSMIALQLQSPADNSPDLTRALQCSDDRSTPNIFGKGFLCAVRDAEGNWMATPAYQALGTSSTASAGLTQYLGASRDLSHAVFRTEQVFLPNDTHRDATDYALYEIAGVGTSTPQLRLVTVDDDGTSFPGTVAQDLPGLGGGNQTGGFPADQYQAVSADGSTIFFSAQPVGGVQTVYARVNGEHTVTVSAPECATCSSASAPAYYQGASSDGSRVFFLTAQQLLDSDTDGTTDLYEYDFDQPLSHRLTQVSSGGLGDASPGAGAEVQGVVRTSEDGTHLYFVAHGVLTSLKNGLGQTATDTANNLYIYNKDADHPQGQTKFVATLASSGDETLWDRGDYSRQARTTPNGRYMIFATAAPLITSGPGADTDTAPDVYRYDADTGNVVRVSIGNDMAPTADGRQGNTAGFSAAITPIGAGNSASGFAAHANVNDVGRSISDDGSTVIFATAEPLQTGDVNGAAPATCLASGGITTTSPGCDIYEWRDGVVNMISDGSDADGADNSRAAVTGISVLGMSASGSAIFFATRTQLVGQDADAQRDVYVARVNGGVPFAPPIACSGDSCQGAAAPSPFAPALGSGAVGPPAGPDAAAPTFVIRSVTAAERKKFASSGKLLMSATASSAGILSASATATIGKRSTSVASTKKAVAAGQTVMLALTLSKAARSELGRVGKLTVRVAVSHSNVAVSQTSTIKLTHVKAKKAVCKTRSQKRSKACKVSAKRRSAVSSRGASR
jgi:hypothetical protein